MSGRPDPDQLSVTERQSGYSSSSDRPVDDTSAHTRETPMPVEWALDPVVRPHAAGTNANIPDLRKSLRNTDDVERDRKEPLPRWVPMLGAGAVVLLLVAAGVVALVISLQVRAPTPKAAPAPVEDLEGVPVRKGLNSPDAG